MSLVKEAFDNHASYVRKGFNKRERAKTVGASEIGQCARKVWYDKHHVDYDPEFIDGWGASKRGSVFESRFFVPAMRKKYGINLQWAGTQQKRFVDKYLSATPDGILVDQPKDLLAGLMVPDIGPSRCVVVDCKTIDPRINLSDPKPHHVFQVTVQLGLIRKLSKYKPDYAVLVYTNASFYDDTVEFVVKFDPEVFEHAYRRANQIMISSLASDLKPEGWIAGGDECKYCPFSRSCRALRGDVPAAEKGSRVDPQLISELLDLAREERLASERIKAAEYQHRDAQEKIKARLREKGLSSIKESGISILWSAVKGRPSYDMPGIKAAAAAAGVNLQRFETTGDRTDRLTVSITTQDRLVKQKGTR
jgi:CRISPR/Cas system-associated exonuclease Cas4 (RecB family)